MIDNCNSNGLAPDLEFPFEFELSKNNSKEQLLNRKIKRYVSPDRYNLIRSSIKNLVEFDGICGDKNGVIVYIKKDEGSRNV